MLYPAARAGTGAVSCNRQIGRLEQPQGGTPFLDEISEATAGFQAKFTFQGETVLQSGLFQRETALELGSERGAFMSQVREMIRNLAAQPSMVQTASWGWLKRQFR